MGDESNVPLSVRVWMMRCTFVSEDVDDACDECLCSLRAVVNQEQEFG